MDASTIIDWARELGIWAGLAFAAGAIYLHMERD